MNLVLLAENCVITSIFSFKISPLSPICLPINLWAGEVLVMVRSHQENYANNRQPTPVVTENPNPSPKWRRFRFRLFSRCFFHIGAGE